ncbi:hypothetical protein [Euzebya sp.]|uniref:hypothetical protein n=1 Tax=Euzebya sp. TaxID=1971409 RepID=UPI003513C5C4
MHQQVNRQSVRERVRTERVVRRIERQRYGQSTRDFHRRQRLQRVAFGLLVAVVALSALALAVS